MEKERGKDEQKGIGKKKSWRGRNPQQLELRWDWRDKEKELRNKNWKKRKSLGVDEEELMRKSWEKKK